MQNENSPAAPLVTLDRSLGIPVRQQIRAALVHHVSSGRLGPGAALPSVRDLAETLGVAPMTVSKVYADLKESGLVEARVGSGTFVADSPLAQIAARDEIAATLTELDGLVDRIAAAGLEASDLLALLNARAIRRVAGGTRPSVLVVGLFNDATRSYAQRVAEQVGPAAIVTPLVLGTDPGQVDPPDAALLRGACLVVTFASLHERIAAIAPGTPIVSVRFIPAESTRMALASLDPMARIAVVSRFADFLPVLELGVRRFAPHVAQVTALDMAAPELGRVVAECDVVVMSTGAEAAADLAPRDAVRIEYRHIPDPGDLARLVLPRLAALPRTGAPAQADPTQDSPAGKARAASDRKAAS